MFKYKERILRFSKLDEDDLLDVLYRLVKKITFVNEDTSSDEIWEEARRLTDDIDSKDTPFVALSLSLNATLWTGDRTLAEGPQAKGFSQVVDTPTLMNRLSLTK